MMSEALLPCFAFLRTPAGEHKNVIVDAEYLADRHAVLLPRFALVGEDDEIDAIGVEYGQPVEFRGDLVVGTTEQLLRLRVLFESYRAEEATDADAIEYWARIIEPLDAAIGTARFDRHAMQVAA